jgi:hypothetical protein
MELPATTFGHGPALAIFTVERDVERTVIERVAASVFSRKCIIRREDTADECDNRQAVAAISTQRINVPPGIAAA